MGKKLSYKKALELYDEDILQTDIFDWWGELTNEERYKIWIRTHEI